MQLSRLRGVLNPPLWKKKFLLVGSMVDRPCSHNGTREKMSDSKIFKIPPHSDRYEAVMREAARRAVARMNSDMDTEPEFDAEVDALVTDTEPEFDAEVDALVTVTDLFEALCCVHPTVFSELLGGLITVPAVEPAEDVDDDTEVFYSAEVDKYLSLYGGAIMTVIEMIADEEVVLDSLHIAAVLLKEQPPEVKNLLWPKHLRHHHAQERVRRVKRDPGTHLKGRRASARQDYRGAGEIRADFPFHAAAGRCAHAVP